MATTKVGSAEQQARAMQVDKGVSEMADGDRLTVDGWITATKADGSWTVKAKNHTTFTTPSRKEAIVYVRQCQGTWSWTEPDLIAKQAKRKEREQRKAEAAAKRTAKEQSSEEQSTDAA